jgi:hypothetical protein
MAMDSVRIASPYDVRMNIKMANKNKELNGAWIKKIHVESVSL